MAVCPRPQVAHFCPIFGRVVGSFLRKEHARNAERTRIFDSDGRHAQQHHELRKCKSPHHNNNEGSRDRFNKYVFVESLSNNFEEDGGGKKGRVHTCTAVARATKAMAGYECDCVVCGKGGVHWFIGFTMIIILIRVD